MTEKICKISLFSVILASVLGMPADARITVKKSGSYANAYNQVMNVRQQAEYMSQNQIVATTNSATPTLPVAVDDANLAQDILNNVANNVNTDVLENCSMIYPNGLFRWGVPEAGIRKNPTNQCIALIELRDANTNTVLAQTTLAAGDAMKCNIDMFPESGWMNELANVELPADAAPTMAQVEAVMNQEQKQNAGLKIAAAALISGVAGNMLAPKDAGDTKLMGTSKTQLIDTAIGATAGAGIMAASTYTGKVAGDTIKSTAVNAAAGMVIGNMAAGMSGGNGILHTTKCFADGIEQDCVIGQIRVTDKNNVYKYDPSTNPIYFVNAKTVIKCDNCAGGLGTQTCVNSCNPVRSGELINIKISVNHKLTLIDSMKYDRNGWDNVDLKYIKTKEGFEQTTNSQVVTDEDVFYPVAEAIPAGKNSDKLAYAVFYSLPRKFNGYKTSDWDASLSGMEHRYYSRNLDGSVGSEIKKSDDKDELIFIPTERNASDGPLVDLSNEARNKATVTGAVAGGAIGGFSGYQGAKQEVSERWTTAVREYDDSLSKFYCATGTRFLSKYNDYIEIPVMQNFNK